MKKLITLTLTGLLLISCGSQKVLESYWHDENFTKSIAGKLKYDEESGFMYAVSNDKENLYIDIRVSDKTVQRKILSMGMTVWIDTTGKKQETMGVTFPIGMRTAMAGRRQERSQSQEAEQVRRPSNRQQSGSMIKAATSKIKLTGFVDINELNNSNEVIPGVISGKLERDAMNILQYTLVIPFERIPTIKNKKFSIGIKTGFIDMSDMAAMRERMMAQGGRRPQGGEGSGQRGQRPGGAFSPEDMERMTTPTELWLKNIQVSNI
jgi:hypothetical protein